MVLDGKLIGEVPILAKIEPIPIMLTSAEKGDLLRRAANIRSYFQVLRARMILHAAEGMSNDEIARRLDLALPRADQRW
jgi:hypothetical protein